MKMDGVKQKRNRLMENWIDNDGLRKELMTYIQYSGNGVKKMTSCVWRKEYFMK